MPDATPTEAPPEVLSFEEANARYDGEWVLLRVTALDEHHRISHGEVLGHSADRKQISRALKRLHKVDPHAHTCVFLGGMILGDREAIQQAVRRAADAAAAHA